MIFSLSLSPWRSLSRAGALFIIQVNAPAHTPLGWLIKVSLYRLHSPGSLAPVFVTADASTTLWRPAGTSNHSG